MDGVNFRASNLVCVCMDSIGESEIGGRLYHRYSQEPVPVRSISELLGEMEDFFDAIKYPQASTEPRSFRSKREPAKARETEMREVGEGHNITEMRGEKGTLLIHVQSRQNSSWQGAVLWAEREITQGFSSVLELLKLIDSCVEELREAS